MGSYSLAAPEHFQPAQAPPPDEWRDCRRPPRRADRHDVELVTAAAVALGEGPGPDELLHRGAGPAGQRVPCGRQLIEVIERTDDPGGRAGLGRAGGNGGALRKICRSRIFLHFAKSDVCHKADFSEMGKFL